jgi:hypothetical protein
MPRAMTTEKEERDELYKETMLYSCMGEECVDGTWEWRQRSKEKHELDKVTPCAADPYAQISLVS